MKSKVYLARLGDGASTAGQADALARAVSAAGFISTLSKQDMVAVKVHVGEGQNNTHMRPEVVARAVAMIKNVGAKPFLTDTATLYRGNREDGIVHALHAHEHGFGIEAMGAPFIPADGLVGIHEKEVAIGGELSKSVKIAAEVFMAEAILVVSHVTGHMESGLGAAIKNVGMGLASRAGKMRQHSSINPEIDPEKCEGCGKCRKWCPTDAIGETEGISFIQRDKCIGCGECIALCRFGAVKYNYQVESATMQKSMAEHAAGALAHFGAKKAFVNIMVDMTRDCDCWNRAQQKALPDIGIAASIDPVALDKATMDLTEKAQGKSLPAMAYPHIKPEIQLTHAQKMGMGTMEYEIEEI